MIILILCIFLNACIGVVFKYFEKYKIDNLQAIVVNYFVCVVTAAIVVQSNPIPDDVMIKPWFWYAVALGSIFIIVFNLMALTVQHFGIMVATVFQKMSLIAPALLAIIVFGESSGVIKGIGILCSIIAIYLLSNNATNDKDTVIDKKGIIWMLPLLTLLGSCFIDSTLYFVDKMEYVDNGDVGFVASLFLSAGINGLIILTIQVIRKKEEIKFKNILAGICLGIPNFFSIYLLILALQQGWGGSVVFPINNVGVLLLAAVFGILFFKESISRIKLLGFGFAILAIILIALS